MKNHIAHRLLINRSLDYEESIQSATQPEKLEEEEEEPENKK